VSALVFVKDGGENGWTIKTRPAKPVDRSIPGNQGCGATIADHSIIVNLWNLLAIEHNTIIDD
jgi:hypothetical protein